MIAYLKGELVVKSEEYIIIEVQGIGYKVFMSKKSKKFNLFTQPISSCCKSNYCCT